LSAKDGKQVKLYSRPGNDPTKPISAHHRLRSRSCIIEDFGDADVWRAAHQAVRELMRKP
jgi:hypothetical protein